LSLRKIIPWWQQVLFWIWSMSSDLSHSLSRNLHVLWSGWWEILFTDIEV
jgi:hypothetical protein